MTTEQDRQLVPMKADDPPPLEVARFEFSVSPPSLCNVGSLPYPLVVKGPEPAFGLPIGQKTCMTELIIWQWFDSGEYRKVKSISKQQPGLGPFGSQAMILEDIRLEKPGKYMFEYFVSLWDGQEGKITRRARVASHEFSVQEGYDNTTIRRSKKIYHSTTGFV